DLAGALGSSRIVILVDPMRRPEPVESRALGAFLRGGGRLLVLDSIRNVDSTAGSITGPFGLFAGATLSRMGRGAAPVVPALATEAPEGWSRRPLRGGAVALWRDVGAGRLVLATDSALFSDRGFGGVYTTPGDEQRAVYEGQEDLMQILLEPRATGR